VLPNASDSGCVKRPGLQRDGGPASRMMIMDERPLPEGKQGVGPSPTARMLDLALDAADMGELVVDLPTGRVRHSERAARILGLAPGQGCTARELLARLHPGDRPLLSRSLRQMRWRGAPATQELRVRRPDGEQRVVHLRSEFIAGPDGRLGRLAGVVRDVTDRHLAEERLLASENRLLDLANESDLALREVNHRVKNSLQLVASLLALQACGAGDAETRHVLDDACRRVVTVARLHERLYRREGAGRVPFDDYLADLCRDLTTALGLDGRQRRIEVQAASATLSIDQAVPLALIVNELVTNAVKHALKPGVRGAVRVSFARVGASYALGVEDDGPGLPAGFDVDLAQSMGLKTVRVMTRQLGGRLELRPGPGARSTIVINAE